MTILACFKSASRRLLGQDQNSLFTGSTAFQIKMQEIISEAILDIAQEHDWKALTRLCTLEADGSTQDFPLPADYDRMLVKADVHSSLWFRTYAAAKDMDEWLMLKNFMPSDIPGYWTLYSGQMHIMPAPPAGEKPQFGYITNLLVKDANGALKTAFTTDSDSFVLDEQLLLLAMLWRWKAAEGLDYQEDMQNYENRKSQLAAKDHGSRPIRSNRRYRTAGGIWSIGR